MLSQHIVLMSLFLVLLFCSHLTWTWFKLRNIPGPFWAKLTNIPRFYWVWTRHAHEIHIKLHELYGKLVRMGPNMVSVGDPAEIDKIYRMHDPLQKVWKGLPGIGSLVV